MRFPAWVGAISRLGIARSNRERLSRVSPRSFGPIVSFLEKSKLSKILDLEKSLNLRYGCSFDQFPKPTCVLWPRFWRCAKFCDTSCLKNFCLLEYAILAKIKPAGFGDFDIFWNFLDFAWYTTGTRLAPSVAKFNFDHGFGKRDSFYVFHVTRSFLAEMLW